MVDVTCFFAAGLAGALAGALAGVFAFWAKDSCPQKAINSAITIARIAVLKGISKSAPGMLSIKQLRAEGKSPRPESYMRGNSVNGCGYGSVPAR